jgi:hypothetical protein
MVSSKVVVGVVAVAAIVGLAVFLRPKPVARNELRPAGSIPPQALSILESKMARHDEQMNDLLARVLMLDDDGIARAAGSIFDEPELTRPALGNELNALLPDRFFALQDDLRQHARRLVAASGRHDRPAVAEEFGALAKSCISCHEIYLYETGAQVTRPGARP